MNKDYAFLDIYDSYKTDDIFESQNNLYENLINLRQRMNTVYAEEDRFLKAYFAHKGFNLDNPSTTGSINGGGIEANFRVLPKKVRQQRKQLNTAIREQFANCIHKLVEGNYEISKHPYSKIDSREFIMFFGDRFKPSKDELKGVNVANALSDKNVSLQEKQRLFAEYIDEFAKNVMKYAQYKNDTEFVENFADLSNLTHAFNLENASKMFEGLTGGEKLDPTIEEKYNNYRDIFQALGMAMNSKGALIADPTYEYFEYEDLKEIGKVCDEDILFGNDELNNLSFKEGKKQRLNIVVFPSKHEERIKNLGNAKGAFKALLQSGVIKTDSRFITHNGDIISEKDVHLPFDLNSTFGVIGKDGKMRAIQVAKDFHFEIQEIPDEKPNVRNSYQKLLDTLNKGTSIFVKSSDEYKNMRSDLSKLAAGKGNEGDLLNNLSENINRYLENYKKKSPISALAYKRKELVLQVQEELKELKNEFLFGDKLRAEKLNFLNDLKQANHNEVRKNIVIDDIDAGRVEELTIKSDKHSLKKALTLDEGKLESKEEHVSEAQRNLDKLLEAANDDSNSKPLTEEELLQVNNELDDRIKELTSDDEIKK